MPKGNKGDSDLFDICEAPDVESVDDILYEDNAYAINIDKPYIRVQTENLKAALTISKMISARTGRDIVNRTVGLSSKEGKLQVLLSNQDDYAELSIKLDNEDNVLDDFILINYYYLHTLVYSSFDYFVLYKDQDSYFAKILGGDIKLITESNIQKTQIMLPEKNKFKNIGSIDMVDFQVVKKCELLANCNFSRSQRRVFVNNNHIMSFCINTILFYKSKKVIPNINFRLRDVYVIGKLAKIYDSKVLKISKTEERMMIYGDEFAYSYLVNSENIDKNYSINISTIQPTIISLSEFKKLLFLSLKYPDTQNKLRFNYTENGQIQCIVLMKSLLFKALLGKENKSKPTMLEEDIRVNAHYLNELISTFNSEEVDLFLSKEAIIIKSGDLTGHCYSSED